MNIIYIEQVITPDKRLRTFVDNETISVELEVNGQLFTDAFDFSTITEDGVCTEFETDLPFNPILSAKRENGVLTVEIIEDQWEEDDAYGEDHMEATD